MGVFESNFFFHLQNFDSICYLNELKLHFRNLLHALYLTHFFVQFNPYLQICWFAEVCCFFFFNASKKHASPKRRI